MAKEIGKGFDGMFNKGKNEFAPEHKQEKPKEKLFVEIDADLKTRLQMYKVTSKTALNNIVEAALTEYLNKKEK